MGKARATALLLVLGVLPIAAPAQVWDNSGNSLLNGTYYFRQVVYIAADINGDLSEAISLYGNITFNGNGTYTISNAIVNDSADQYGPDALPCYLAGQQCSSSSTTVPGTYSIAASGYGFISSPIFGGDSIYGLLSNGVFIASSTENSNPNYPYNDLFIAAPVGSGSTNASFNGAYTAASLLPAGSPDSAADVFFQMNPNGAGSLGTVNMTGYYGTTGASTLSQSSSGVTYKFSSGAAVVTFPNNANAPFFEGSPSSQNYPAAVFGPVYLYFSPDGNFFFGGSPYGYEMVVGVRNDNSALNSGAIYYTAGLDLDTSTLAAGYGTFDSFYGSFSSTNGSIIEADRLLSISNANVYVSTFGDSTTDTTYAQYAFANGGAIRIGAGKGPFLGLSVSIRAPKSPGSAGQSVYLDPTAIQDAASFAPLTAGISAGELITLYGSNLAANTVVASTTPFPNKLGNVQVMINGVAAPIYYVSAGQLAVIVPYETTTAVAQIQVVNNNTASNTITAFVNETTTGVFSQLQGSQPPGLGYAIALHNADFSLVTPSSPAQPGEYLAFYVTGLGAVTPGVSDGSVGPSNTLSWSNFCQPGATCLISAAISGVTIPVVYAGLAPGLAGIYQINVQIPASGVPAGDQTLQICGPDSCTSESLIPVGGLSASVAEPHASAMPRSAGRSRTRSFPPKPTFTRSGSVPSEPR